MQIIWFVNDSHIKKQQEILNTYLPIKIILEQPWTPTFSPNHTDSRSNPKFGNWYCLRVYMRLTVYTNTWLYFVPLSHLEILDPYQQTLYNVQYIKNTLTTCIYQRLAIAPFVKVQVHWLQSLQLNW